MRLLKKRKPLTEEEIQRFYELGLKFNHFFKRYKVKKISIYLLIILFVLSFYNLFFYKNNITEDVPLQGIKTLEINDSYYKLQKLNHTIDSDMRTTIDSATLLLKKEKLNKEDSIELVLLYQKYESLKNLSK